MVGLGETDDEILAVMRDLRRARGRYADDRAVPRPSPHHLPVSATLIRSVQEYEKQADRLGFKHAAIGPLVRSSYHADRQAHEAGVA